MILNFEITVQLLVHCFCHHFCEQDVPKEIMQLCLHQNILLLPVSQKYHQFKGDFENTRIGMTSNNKNNTYFDADGFPRCLLIDTDVSIGKMREQSVEMQQLTREEWNV